MAEIINGKELYNIVRKTLSMMNEEVIRHGEISGYILYKMLQMDNQYNKQDLVDYTMVGILHDLGIYKIQDFDDIATFKPVNAWSHSIYGYLCVICLHFPNMQTSYCITTYIITNLVTLIAKTAL